ncbi:hypothetical protein CAter10_4313 [Collimonas arenae]|nr:hypothetical protein CAter10_4313 [Collimonas arenae]
MSGIRQTAGISSYQLFPLCPAQSAALEEQTVQHGRARRISFFQ